MRKINIQKDSLNTPVSVELTIGELLNISYAVSHVAPNVAGEVIVSTFGLSPMDEREIVGDTSNPILYQLAFQCRQILKEYGYEYNLDSIKYNDKETIESNG